MLIQIVRSIDGLLYTMVIAVVLAIHPTLGRDVLGRPDLLTVAPVMFVGVFCLRLPLEFDAIAKWNQMIFRIRLLSGSLIFLSPFLIWWIHTPNNNYFYVNSFLAVTCIYALLFQLSMLVYELSRFGAYRYLRIESFVTMSVILYLFVLPILSIPVSYLMHSYIHSSNEFGQLFMHLSMIPRVYRVVLGCVLLSPVVISISQLFRLRILMMKQLSRLNLAS